MIKKLLSVKHRKRGDYFRFKKIGTRIGSRNISVKF